MGLAADGGFLQLLAVGIFTVTGVQFSLPGGVGFAGLSSSSDSSSSRLTLTSLCGRPRASFQCSDEDAMAELLFLLERNIIQILPRSSKFTSLIHFGRGRIRFIIIIIITAHDIIKRVVFTHSIQ